MFSTAIKRSFSSTTTTAMRSNHSKVAIIGAGSGGHTTLAQLVKSGAVTQQDITVFDPSEEHHY